MNEINFNKKENNIININCNKKYNITPLFLKKFINRNSYKNLLILFNENDIIFKLNLYNQDIKIIKNDDNDINFSLLFKEYNDDDEIIINKNYINNLNNSNFKIIIKFEFKINLKFKCNIELNKNNLRSKLKNESLKLKNNDNQIISHPLLNGIDFEEFKLIKLYNKFYPLYKENKLKNDCTICLEKIKTFCIIGCSHYFCLECFKNWSNLNNKCPNCKKRTHIFIYENNKKFSIEYINDKKSLKKVNNEIINLCEVCENDDNSSLLLICSECCDTFCHTYCLQKKIEELPKEKWICDYCVIFFKSKTNLPLIGIFDDFKTINKDKNNDINLLK